MVKYPTLTIRLPQETLHWLKVEAELQDTSNAQIVKQALDLYYRTQHPRRGRCAGCSSPMKAGERSEVQSSPLGAVFGSTGLKPV